MVKWLIVVFRDTLEGHDQYPLYQKAEAMAKFVVPEEYGIDRQVFVGQLGSFIQNKFDIGSLICQPLVQKIYEDMIDISKGKGGRARFYFSSESHLHTLR